MQSKVETIEIYDKWLEYALKEEILGGNNELTQENLEELTELNWADYRQEAGETFGAIRNLRGIEHCKNLTNVGLDGNSISSFEELALLPKLKEIYLCGNSIEKIPNLSQLTQLKTLVLDYNNTLSNIFGLAFHPSLEYLNVTSSKISDITVLETLPKLKKLAIRYVTTDFSEGSPNYNTLIRLFKRGVEITCPNSEELKKAAEHSDLDPEGDELIRFLCKNNAYGLLRNVNTCGIHGRPGYMPIHFALNRNCMNELEEIAQYSRAEKVTNLKGIIAKLIAEGADVNQVKIFKDLKGNEYEGTPLYAYFHSYVDRYAENDDNLDKEIIDLLLEHGAVVTDRIVMASYPSKTYSAYIHSLYKGLPTTDLFYYYCYEASFKHVKESIDNGFLERIEDKKEVLSIGLFKASWKNNAELVQYLIDQGADPNHSQLPIFQVIYEQVLSTFVSNGVDINVRNELLYTPLIYFIHTGSNKLAIQLIDLGAELDLQNSSGTSALHEICNKFNALAEYLKDNKKYFDVVQALVDGGANLNLLNKENKTPRDIAKKDLKKLIVKLGGKTGKAVLKEKGE